MKGPLMNDHSPAPRPEDEPRAPLFGEKLDTDLTSYLVGELSLEDRMRVEEELVSNAAFRAEHDARKKSLALLHAAAGEKPVLAEERRAALEAAATTVPAASPKRTRPLLIPLGVAAAMLIAVALFSLTQVVSLSRKKTEPRDDVASRHKGQEVRAVVTQTPASKPTPAVSPVAETVHEQVKSSEMPGQAPSVRTPGGSSVGKNALTPTQQPPARSGSALRRDMKHAPRILADSPSHDPRTKPDRIVAPSLARRSRAAMKENAFYDPSARWDKDRAGGGQRDSLRPDESGDSQTITREQVSSLLERLRRQKDESPAAMFFRYWGDNPFVTTATDPQSTFGLDVDTASYTLARSYLARGALPPKAAVRTEEFVNYFPSRYPAPTNTDLAIHAEIAPSQFAHRENVYLLKVGVKAREVADVDRKSLSLTLVIDVSGSMKQENRLELVKDAMRTLLTRLREGDSVGIVSFSTTANEVLSPTSALKATKILGALSQLQPRGSTNVQQGLELGYAMALRHLQEDGSNRVVLLSDGVANTGLVTPEQILGRIDECREKGVLLNTFGVGMGNHNDYLMEQLADRGDGICAYVDSPQEARRLFQESLAGTFETVARDAKIQVEFDPGVVLAYRQIGYENRAIADKDFRNDKVDAGEVNAGHEAVALYELETRGALAKSPGIIRLRYKTMADEEIVELAKQAPGESVSRFEDASPRFRLSACVAGLAEHLRRSYWSRASTMGEVIELATELRVLEGAGETRISEFIELASRAEMFLSRKPGANDFGRVIDELKRNHYLKARYDELNGKNAAEILEKLEEQNLLLEEQIRKLADG